MRSSGGTKLGLAWSVVALTKSRIACFAGPSFHDPNALPCVVWVWAIAVRGIPDKTGRNATPEINTRRLMLDDGRSDFIVASLNLLGPCASSFHQSIAVRF